MTSVFVRSRIKGTGVNQQTGWDNVDIDTTNAGSLTFAQVREQNMARCRRWHGDKPWELNRWAVALTGEVGELCNVIKKLNRIADAIQHIGMDERVLREELPKEIADIFLYLDLLAAHAGVDLAAAVIQKFNVVSVKYDFPERLAPPAPAVDASR